MKRLLIWLPRVCAAISLQAMISAHAGVYLLPPLAGDSLIGEEQIVLAREEDTLIDIARRHNLGFDDIVNANPAVDTWLPREGTPVLLPLRHLLPATPREGIVINVAEKRLYYYPGTYSPAIKVANTKKGGKATPPARVAATAVEVHPVSIGRSDWNTPIVSTRVVRKATDPVWYPPEALRAEHAADGDYLPEVVTPGPDNPLGQYALYLGTPSYLIHGTNKAFGIGMQVTHGCIRMYPEDIQHLYEAVAVGTPVHIVNQPYKVGWSNGVLYVEVHPWLEGSPAEQVSNKSLLTTMITTAINPYPDYPIDWQTVELLGIEARGVPVAVGPTLTPITPVSP